MWNAALNYDTVGKRELITFQLVTCILMEKSVAFFIRGERNIVRAY